MLYSLTRGGHQTRCMRIAESMFGNLYSTLRLVLIRSLGKVKRKHSKDVNLYPQPSIYRSLWATLKEWRITVVGSCSHPGYFDGNDHPVSDHPAELVTTTGSTCSGTFKWTQNHDSNNGHAATFWYKSYTQPVGGGLIGTFAAN
jgi:hypothetical protein